MSVCGTVILAVIHWKPIWAPCVVRPSRVHTTAHAETRFYSLYSNWHAVESAYAQTLHLHMKNLFFCYEVVFCTLVHLLMPKQFLNYRLGLGSWFILPTFPGSDQLVDSFLCLLLVCELLAQLSCRKSSGKVVWKLLYLIFEDVGFLSNKLHFLYFCDQKTKMCHRISLILVMVSLLDSHIVLIFWWMVSVYVKGIVEIGGCTRYLFIGSVVPSLGGSQHTSSLENQPFLQQTKAIISIYSLFKATRLPWQKQ